MTTTGFDQGTPEREVVRCVHCGMNQFRTEAEACRRCRRPLPRRGVWRDVPRDPDEAEGASRTHADPEARARRMRALQDPSRHFTARVERLRLRLGMSVNALARRLREMGVSHASAYRAQQRKGKHFPALGTRLCLARVLEVDVLELTHGTVGESEAG